MTKPSSTLDAWAKAPFTGGGFTYDCFSRGEGAGVVVIPEIPGISPEVLAFADTLVDNGFSVMIPSLFGTPGKPVSVPYALGTAAKLCVASEMKAFATNAERPVSQFLRALARDLNARTPGKGVGVVGMCFTGGFALATAVDDSVLAAVASQPGVPFAVGKARTRDIGLSPAETKTIKDRSADGLCLMGLKFSKDPLVKQSRFDSLAATFGDQIELIVLDSSKGNPDGYKSAAHSVLTEEVRVSPNNSAGDARDRVVQFLKDAITA